ncbi:hypothetical protein [Natronorubrum bangense]|uniref:Uncharacterized protein n=2 Tax=Natronorubrum bangense TaxID=61858 RepID=L9WFU9_9EURY|nr:hypothetical protein [Natronorubrum bangense]ELY47183.1 hypothetical protein C494_13311 [Natronorubrum bangense JCM 10635]QCC53384.1 hypothetical protein DV706_02125 [Natronorubrum bangense]
MVEMEWPQLSGTELQYSDHSWELTGTVDVGPTGDVLGAEAKQVDDVRQRNATLRFGLQDGAPSLNPGEMGSHFDRIEQAGATKHLVVKTDTRTYRYRLHGLEYR